MKLQISLPNLSWSVLFCLVYLLLRLYFYFLSFNEVVRYILNSFHLIFPIRVPIHLFGHYSNEGTKILNVSHSACINFVNFRFCSYFLNSLLCTFGFRSVTVNGYLATIFYFYNGTSLFSQRTNSFSTFTYYISYFFSVNLNDSACGAFQIVFLWRQIYTSFMLAKICALAV